MKKEPNGVDYKGGFGSSGLDPWRSARIEGLTELACLELLASAAKSNSKGSGMAICYDGGVGLLLSEAVRTVYF